MSERDNNNNGKTEHKKMRYMFMRYREWVSERKVGRATKRIFKQNLGERKKKHPNSTWYRQTLKCYIAIDVRMKFNWN